MRHSVDICDGCGERIEYATVAAQVDQALTEWAVVKVITTNRSGHSTQRDYDVCGTCRVKLLGVLGSKRSG